MRGRLINPFILEIRQLDTDATSQAGNYDDDFREPTPSPSGPTHDGRQEKASIFVPVQVEPTDYEKMLMTPAGDDPQSKMVFIMHFQDLEEAGLVDTNGQPKIRLGDRATSIRHYDDNSLIQTLALDGQGFFVTSLVPTSFGLSGGERNLLICTIECRDKAVHG